jgi:hypothetical protein
VRRKVAIALVGVAVAVGVWLGLWEAHFSIASVAVPLPMPSLRAFDRPPNPLLPIPQPQFARWLCALLGAGAAAVVALIALAVDRWPKPTYSN